MLISILSACSILNEFHFVSDLHLYKEIAGVGMDHNTTLHYCRLGVKLNWDGLNL